MQDRVEQEVALQGAELLGRAPGLADHPAGMGADHSGRVIEREQGIPDPLLELALPVIPGLAPWSGLMDGVRQLPAKRHCVPWALVAQHLKPLWAEHCF